MNLIIQSQYITPDMLRKIADNIEETGLPSGKSPAKYQILSDNETLSELYDNIENNADKARDELDDVVIGLQGLTTLYDKAIKELDTKYPNDNIKAYFDDIIEYTGIIMKHAQEARDVVVSINTDINPEYRFTELPPYSVIT